jgi:hypothetical protein
MKDDIAFSMNRAAVAELLILLHVGAHALEEHGSASSASARALEQIVLQQMRDAGAGPLVEEEHGKLVPSEEIREKAHRLFDDFIEDSFWEELIIRLGKRDRMRELSAEDGADAEEESERAALAKARPYELPYEAEFDTFGLDRLEINKNAPVSDLRDIL